MSDSAIARLLREAYDDQLIAALGTPKVPMQSRLSQQRWQADAEEERRRKERWDKRFQARQAFVDALAAVSDPVARAVLELHARDGDGFYVDCKGCDYAGWEGEPPEWPCRTVRLIADRFHIKEEGE